jgi:hypothetical protein
LGNLTGTMTTPFTRGQMVDGELVLEAPKQQQHFEIVQALKTQRALNNVDGIVSNNGKLTYKCVWVWAGSKAVPPDNDWITK